MSFSIDNPSSKPSVIVSPWKPINLEAKNFILNHFMEWVNPPPPPPPRVDTWVESRCVPLALPSHLHGILEHYLKILPKFYREKDISTDGHMALFQYFTNNIFIEHDDVYMRPFVQTLEGYVWKWFRGFPNNSVES